MERPSDMSVLHLKVNWQIIRCLGERVSSSGVCPTDPGCTHPMNACCLHLSEAILVAAFSPELLFWEQSKVLCNMPCECQSVLLGKEVYTSCTSSSCLQDNFDHFGAQRTEAEAVLIVMRQSHVFVSFGVLVGVKLPSGNSIGTISPEILERQIEEAPVLWEGEADSVS